MNVWVVLHLRYSVRNVYGIFHSERAARAWINEAVDQNDRRDYSVFQVESTAP
jgi:hypothetical protein